MLSHPRSTRIEECRSYAYMSCIAMGGYGQNPAENDLAEAQRSPGHQAANNQQSTAVAVASAAALSVPPANLFPQPNPCPPACLPASLCLPLACLPPCLHCDGVLRNSQSSSLFPSHPSTPHVPHRPPQLPRPLRSHKPNAIVPTIRSDLIASFFRAPSHADPIRFERRQSIARIAARPNSRTVGGFPVGFVFVWFCCSIRLSRSQSCYP